MENKNFLFVFLFFFTFSFNFNTAAQNTFTISGSSVDLKTKIALDHTILIIISTGNHEYKIHCDAKGRYKAILPDSLNGQTLWVRAIQDKALVNQEKTKEPCSTSCTLIPVYEFRAGKRLHINTDSSRIYMIHFGGRLINNHLRFPKLYFKTNQLELLQTSYYPPPDSAICDVKNILQCNKKWVIEIQGHCSSEEENKTQLSKNRAELLKEKLISMGIQPNRLITKGYGDMVLESREYIDEQSDDQRVIPISVNETEKQIVSFVVIRRNFEE